MRMIISKYWPLAVFLAIAALGGAVLDYLSGLGFWVCAGIVAASMKLNGMLADKGDRNKLED